jgi:hypothetical protein
VRDVADGCRTAAAWRSHLAIWGDPCLACHSCLFSPPSTMQPMQLQRVTSHHAALLLALLPRPSLRHFLNPTIKTLVVFSIDLPRSANRLIGPLPPLEMNHSQAKRHLVPLEVK